MDNLAEVRIRHGVGWGKSRGPVAKAQKPALPNRGLNGEWYGGDRKDRAAQGSREQVPVDGSLRPCCKDEFTLTTFVTPLKVGSPCLRLLTTHQ